MARTKRGADGESRVVPDDDCPSSTTRASHFASESHVRSQYETASLEFGKGGAASSCFHSKHKITAEATRKLANDLNEFQAKLGRNNGGTTTEAAAAAPATYNHVPPEMVESLQLSSCRKLRQVRSKQQVCVYIYRFAHFLRGCFTCTLSSVLLVTHSLNNHFHNYYSLVL
jgi:hypothetical protein